MYWMIIYHRAIDIDNHMVGKLLVARWLPKKYGRIRVLVAPKRSLPSQTAWGCQDSNVILLAPLFYTSGAIYSRLMIIQTGEA